MKVDVNFNYLEKRNYIHSTSMTYSLISILQENKYITSINDLLYIDAVFKKESTNNGYFIINPDNKVNGNVVYTIKSSNGLLKIYYIESDNQVVSRVPYNENIIVEDAVVNIEKQSVTMNFGSSITNLYNVLVAATKKMIIKLFPQESYTPWTLARYSLYWEKIHKDIINNSFEIQIKNNIDDVYLKSDLIINGEKYGSFYNARSIVGEQK